MRQTRPVKKPLTASQKTARAPKTSKAASQASKLLVLVSVLIAGGAAYYFLQDRGTGPSAPVKAPGAPAEVTDRQSAGAITGNSPPAVLSASITPGIATMNDRLAVQYAGNDPEGDLITWRFRWMVNGSAIQDGPASTLEPGSFRKGDIVQAEVIPSDSSSSAQPFLTQKVAIGNLPPSVSDVSLSPEQAFIGTIITAAPVGSDPDGDTIIYAYQWRVNGKAVGGPVAENTFDTGGLRKRDAVSVSVTGSDGTASTGPIVSGMATLGNRPPRITSVPPPGLQNGVLSYQVTASDPDGDPLSFSLLRGPQGATIDPKSGLVRWELPKGVMFTGKQEISVRAAVDDGDGGSDAQEFSITLQDVLVY